jgi:hypothetical protein
MPNPVLPNTYSLMDVQGSFYHPYVGSFTFSGDQGVGSISFEKTVTRSVLDVAGDGGVMGSAIPGRQGIVHIDIQQVSDIHGFLQTWANALDAAQYNGDVSQWFAATLNFTSLVDGSTHTCTGIAPTKDPTKVYGAQGAHLVWDLLSASIISTTSSNLLNPQS